MAVPRLGRRVIFHSAAHDEPELHLPIMRTVFRGRRRVRLQLLLRTGVGRAHLPRRPSPGQRRSAPPSSKGSGDPAAARAALGLAPGERVRAVRRSGRAGQGLPRTGRAVAAVPPAASRRPPPGPPRAGPRGTPGRRRRRRRRAARPKTSNGGRCRRCEFVVTPFGVGVLQPRRPRGVVGGMLPSS